MMDRTEVVKASLAGDLEILVEATIQGGVQPASARDVASSFEGVTKAIAGVAESLYTTIERVSPQKATVEFSVQVAVESGQLTALLVKGNSTANLRITLEWDRSREPRVVPTP